MNAERHRARVAARGLLILFVALVLQRLSPAEAASTAPKDFPKATFLSGSAIAGEERGKGVLLHASWIDSKGNPQKWFRRTKHFPWPAATEVTTSGFRIRLDGVTYPGNLELGVFRRTGPSDSPAGRRDIFSCPAIPAPESRCRWVPSVADGRTVWEIEIDHVQREGHMYIVAVGTWDEPDDPPRPVGSRHQIGTWIFHARVEP